MRYMIAIGPAIKRKKFAIVTKIHHDACGIERPSEEYGTVDRFYESDDNESDGSIDETHFRRLCMLHFPAEEHSESSPSKHHNSCPIIAISKNFTIAITLPFPQKF
jgi:hypothetical protein